MQRCEYLFLKNRPRPSEQDILLFLQELVKQKMPDESDQMIVVFARSLAPRFDALLALNENDFEKAKAELRSNYLT